MCPASSSRWCPTPEQLMILEEMYRSGIRTPNTTQIQQITANLAFYGRIEGKNVFYWFQNHKARDRQKLRKKIARHLRQQQHQPQPQPQPQPPQPQPQLHHQHAMYQINNHHHHDLLRQYQCDCAFRHMPSSSNPSVVCLPHQGINGEAQSKLALMKDDNITGSSYGRSDDWMMMMLMMDIPSSYPSSSSYLPRCNMITVPRQPAPLKTLELFPISSSSSCNFKET